MADGTQRVCGQCKREFATAFDLADATKAVEEALLEGVDRARLASGEVKGMTFVAMSGAFGAKLLGLYADLLGSCPACRKECLETGIPVLALAHRPPDAQPTSSP